MERIEFISERTKFLRLTQYLEIKLFFKISLNLTYDVNLKIRRRRSALNTEIPKLPPFSSAQTTSKALPTMTIQSKRLNFEAKYGR